MKRILFHAALVLCVLGAQAATVTEEMASKAMRNWRMRKDTLGAKLGTEVSGVRRVENGGAAFHVVKFEGGGFVVSSADTTMRPVIFFSEGEDVDEDPRNPLYALLKQDMKRCAEAQQAGVSVKLATASATAAASAEDENERRWAELLDDAVALKFATVKPSDIRVAPLVQTKWSQGEVGYFLTKNCYNYYTPNNYVCGCVATATAQIMRFHQYPTGSVASFTNPNCTVDDETTSLTSKGGTFDWANMPYEPSYSSSDVQRQAIGKLCYDCGVSVSMDYSEDGSGSMCTFVQWALVNRFGYKGAIAAAWKDGNSATNAERTRRAMITNFDAGLPVELGVSGDGGHAIVGDGYGYVDGSFCCHVNMGWAGSYDGWYIPPSIDTFTVIDEIVYNIFPTQAANCVIVSGRILSEAGSAASGVTVQAVKGGSVSASATTNEKGIFALFVQPGTYEIRAESGYYKSVSTVSPQSTTTAKVGLRNGNPWGFNYSDYDVCNVHTGDMKLELVKTDPKATVAFAGEATLGTDFGSVTVPVSAQVQDFGVGSGYSSATVVVTLTSGGAEVGRKTYNVTDLNKHDWDVEFTGLTPGARYELNASVVFGTDPKATADEYLVTAARIARVDRPETAVLASDEVVVNVRLDQFSSSGLGAPSTPSALTAIEQDDGTGRFAYWNGAAWQETGVVAELHVTNEVSILRNTDGGRKFRVKKGETWVDLGPLNESPASLSKVAVTGTAEMVALYGIRPDANRIGCVDGSAEYENLAAAIAAGETRTIQPLWATVGTIPSDVQLLTLAVVDPNGLLTRTGGNLLTTKAGSDGSTIYCYGTMSKSAVQSCDYLRATSALGLKNLIKDQDTSKVRMSDFEATDGVLSFKVTIGDEAVMSQHIKDYVRIAEELANPSWRAPGDSEISVAAGTVTVQPKSSKGRAFAEVVIPKD